MKKYILIGIIGVGIIRTYVYDNGTLAVNDKRVLLQDINDFTGPHTEETAECEYSAQIPMFMVYATGQYSIPPSN